MLSVLKISQMQEWIHPLNSFQVSKALPGFRLTELNTSLIANFIAWKVTQTSLKRSAVLSAEINSASLRGSVGLFTVWLLLHFSFPSSKSFSISNVYHFCCTFILAEMLNFFLTSAFPSSPVVESSGPSLEGETVRLTCSVRDVFPADLFQVMWMDGEKKLFSEARTVSSGLQNLTSGLSYALKAKDNDKLITCKVLLDMVGVPPAHAKKTSSTVLSLHCKSIRFVTVVL